MARKAKGKPLTLRPVRLDDDVWAEILKLKAGHETINEGLRSVLLNESVMPNEPQLSTSHMDSAESQSTTLEYDGSGRIGGVGPENLPSRNGQTLKVSTERRDAPKTLKVVKRGLREKGSKR